MGGVGASADPETEPCGRRKQAAAARQLLGALEQKKEAPSEDGALSNWAEAKSKECGEQAREEDARVAGGHRSREEDSTSTRVSQIRTKGGGFGFDHIDRTEYDL